MLKQIIGQTIGSQGREERRPEPTTPAPVPERPAAAPPIAAAVPPMSQPVRSFTPASSMSTNKNVLSSDVEIKGSLKFSHDLIIDGKIEGEVISDGSLTVGENANIKGEVKTRSVIVFGKIEGNVTVQERCELKSNATLLGDINAGTLSIEEGATFMGQSHVGKRAADNKTPSLGLK